MAGGSVASAVSETEEGESEEKEEDVGDKVGERIGVEVGTGVERDEVAGAGERAGEGAAGDIAEKGVEEDWGVSDGLMVRMECDGGSL